jgi:2-polyprenyl-3-methyl-5-hydroxy-6-metoxy-1,4-benzoquinol methylase
VRCIVCNVEDAEVIDGGYTGYVEGTSFTIYGCSSCGSHFVSPLSFIGTLYENIYETPDISGYDRYHTYARRMKKVKNPLRYLSYSESTYYPVYRYMKNKSALRVLDVGCGYGYLTYALRALRNDAIGIDISENAITFARENFGEYYLHTDVGSLAKTSIERFDVIIATELIEHLPEPHKFVADCLRLLRAGGRIIITTPNKDYHRRDSVWQTDLPPIHFTWLGHEALRCISTLHGLKVQFVDLSKHVFDRNNNLRYFFLSRVGRKIPSVIASDGKPGRAGRSETGSIVRNTLRWLLITNAPVRYLSNAAHNLFFKENPTLAVVLWKD